MTERQQLIEDKREAKQLMRFHAPNKDSMGNMYWHWQSVWKKAHNKLQNLKNPLKK